MSLSCRRARGTRFDRLDLRPFCVVAGCLLPPASRHGEDDLNSSPAGALVRRFRGFRACLRTPMCGACAVSVSNQATPYAYLQGFLTGATGLEPATSGVTDRYGLDRYSRLPPGITAGAGISCRAQTAVTGHDRLPPVRACVVDVQSNWCRIRQQCNRWATSSALFRAPEHRPTRASFACTTDTDRSWIQPVRHATWLRA